MMKQVPPQFDSLQAIYSEVLECRDKNPIEHILVITYEFDDQQLLNLVSGRDLKEDFELRHNRLKIIADMQPVIIYDARKTREFNQLPHFLELLPVKTKAFSCHHSKAYLIVTQKKVRLVLGSLNLTRTGLFHNREVFQDFIWSQENQADLQVLTDFVGLVRHGYEAHNSEAMRTILAELDRRISDWSKSDTGSYTLLASGYSYLPAGILKLKELWQNISEKPPMKVLAVSPFFDKAGGNSPFAEMLTDHLGPIPELVLVTDQANIPLLSQKHYGESSRRELYLIPPVISDSECTQIQRVNDGVSVKDLNIVRKLHAKILVLMGKDKSLVYLGSANFTSKAWNGDNQELGIVWVENGNPEKIARMILQNLYASTANQYEKLPEQPAPTCEVDDDEGYNEESGYPNFVQGIVLGYDKERETVRFEFHCDDLVKLHNYVIGWGNLLLIITGKFSQELKANEFYTRLVGGKNLTFRLKPSGDQVFHVPFRHSPELLQQKDQFLFPTSTDWLQFYLGVSRDTSLNPGEFLPGEEVTPLPVETDIGADIDRNSNLVIKMQQYLNLFSGVEKEFTIRAENIKKCAGDKRITELTKTLLQPLETYARILARERDKDTGNMEYCFKMGELVLFCKSLEDKVPEMNAFARQLSSSLHTDHTHNNPVLKTYLHYCKR